MPIPGFILRAPYANHTDVMPYNLSPYTAFGGKHEMNTAMSNKPNAHNPRSSTTKNHFTTGGI
ncbi:MAG: hypothetical protein JW750_04195 [Anaerolineaceae bacterium]|nr:hypothetical protein [Anaerolineaceae bacterium]